MTASRAAQAGKLTMADCRMTVDARYRVVVGARARHQRVNHGLVAAQAVLLQDGAVSGLDCNGLGEVLKGEALRVMVAIARLGNELGQDSARQVAVDAGGGAMVACLLPAIILTAHDVAVGAGSRIAAEVRESLGVAKGEGAKPKQDARCNCDQQWTVSNKSC